MPSFSFSEVDEHTGAWLEASSVCLLYASMCMCVCMCVFLGDEEVWAHARCLKARIWHFENVTKSPETKKREECDEQTCVLWEVWDLGTEEGRIILSEWETVAQRLRDAEFSWLYTSAASLYNW